MEFSKHLLHWFDQYGRKDLPWQQHVTPYRVWISEIMLQQTQVKTVIPYYHRFMERFPTVEQLATAAEDEVLHLWTGLGYYARARNLHSAAKTVVANHEGTFPQSVDALVNLPGIGKSTAGAIAAIALNQRAPILDGNVKRVLSRCFAIGGYPGDAKVSRELWSLADRLMPSARVADYTQAIMDLGATVCTRRSPLCGTCPVASNCVAHNNGATELYPGRKKPRQLPVKSVSMLVIANLQSEWLLEKRPNQGIWGGLWGFPECPEHAIDEKLSQLNLQPEQVERSEPITPFRHTFTHFHLDIDPVHLQLKAPTGAYSRISPVASIIEATGGSKVEETDIRLWFHPRKGAKIGLTAPVTRLLAQLDVH